MNILYLVGIKHSGKSKLGHVASVALGTRYRTAFADIDELIMQSLKGSGVISVRQFYQSHGKEEFMRREYAALQEYVETLEHYRHDVLIISTGGGACDNEPLVSFMKQSGKLLYLYLPEQILFERILASGIPPFISQEDPKRSFHELFTYRNARYRQISDYMVQLSDYQSVAENGQRLTQAILNLLERGPICQETHLEQL